MSHTLLCDTRSFILKGCPVCSTCVCRNRWNIFLITFQAIKTSSKKLISLLNPVAAGMKAAATCPLPQVPAAGPASAPRGKLIFSFNFDVAHQKWVSDMCAAPKAGLKVIVSILGLIRSFDRMKPGLMLRSLLTKRPLGSDQSLHKVWRTQNGWMTSEWADLWGRVGANAQVRWPAVTWSCHSTRLTEWDWDGLQQIIRSGRSCSVVCGHRCSNKVAAAAV